MSEEKKETKVNKDQPQSTLFSDPNQLYVYEKKPQKKKLLVTSLVALGVVVCVALAAAAIKIFVPDNTDENNSSNSLVTIAVTDYSSDDVEKMTVTTEDYKAVLYSQSEETTSDSTTVNWYIEGVDSTLTSSYDIASAVNSAVALSAVRKMDINDADYGFAEPYATVEIESRNQVFGNYTITVGSVSPDRSGYYLKTSLKEDVYLVSMKDVEKFCQDIYAYANTTVISALTDGDASEEYFSDSTLIKVDSISLSGTYYGSENIQFEANPDKNTSAFMTYVMKTPYRRYADNDKVNPLISPFANGVYAEACYSYDATEDELLTYNLINPEIVITLRVENIRHTLKASKNDDGYYALMIDDVKAIYKVKKAYIEFSPTTAKGFISTVVFSQMLKTFTDIDVNIDGKLYDFNINVVESEEEEDVYNVTAGSLPIEAENFQNYYAQLLGMTLTEISVKTPDAPASMSIRLTRKDGSRTTIVFAKTADRRYHVSVDGDPGGYISATTYENLQNYAVLAYEGKDVPKVTEK